MADVKIRLKQEGVVRLGGYQVTQWCSVLDQTTDPTSYAYLFVIRNTNGIESLERVATPKDFSTYFVNPLRYFEAKSTGGSGLAAALEGDVLVITPPVDVWLQESQPYDDCEFIVSSVQNLSAGSNPQILTGNRVILPGQTLSNEDVGRWLVLSGFATSSYNRAVQILSVAGSTAFVDFVTTTNETGTGWAMRRVAIRSDAGSGNEPRYFPTKRSGLSWELRRNGELVSSGTSGATQRLEPTAKLFRDLRYTSLEPDDQAALALMNTTRHAVQVLQTNASIVDTTFLGEQTYDFPPT